MKKKKMMMMMSNLPRDLTEEVLCRIPLKSLTSVRSTCKTWNTLSKDESFAKKHLAHQAKVAKEEAEEITMVMMKDLKVYLMKFNLSNINVDSSSCIIKREARLIGPYDSSDQIIDVCEVFHYDGLLLCVMKDDTRSLVVWNPYSGQTRCIVPTHNFNILDMYSYAIGYDKSRKSHKILRYIDHRIPAFFELKIYDFNSDSWKVLDLPQDWRIEFYHRGVTLKGNTYWFATEKYWSETEIEDSFLVCFDFTRETFGPCLPLPFEEPCVPEDTVCLTSVREEQLAVLFQRWDTLMMEIWVTTKIEPNAVSWNSKVLLTANIKKLIRPQFQFSFLMSFFIDEKKKIAVVFYHDKDIYPTRDVAYIIGADGSLIEADVGKFLNIVCFPIVCSYVPSLVQLV